MKGQIYTCQALSPNHTPMYESPNLRAAASGAETTAAAAAEEEGAYKIDSM